jgi:phospholipase/carboxylesterase
MAQFNLTTQPDRPVEGFYASAVHAVRRRPIRTFLPTGYEPNYPYPLLVFFHEHAGDETQVLHLAPAVSRRNFIGLSLRGPVRLDSWLPGGAGYSWGPQGELNAVLEDYVFQAIRQTRRHYHVHSERIYLVGVCEGAAPAYRLALAYPDRFAGVISLNGSMPRIDPPRLHLPEARQSSIFIGHGLANVRTPLGLAMADHRLFYAAGLPVTYQTYPTSHRLHADMLRDINRWIIGQSEQPAF